MQFGYQQFLVPAGIEGKLVVSDDVSAPLRRREMIKDDNRHRIEAELARRQQPAVARDHHALGVDQDWVGPAELDDRGRDLLYLIVVVRPGIARIGLDPVDRPVFDRVRQSGRHVVRVWGNRAGGNRGASYRPAVTRRLGEKPASLRACGARKRQPRAVTGNSDFAAVSGEISGHRPPHTFRRQGGPVISKG
jgi:hypothetical protein